MIANSGEWKQLAHVQQNADIELSHGICPDCLGRHYPSLKKQHGR